MKEEIIKRKQKMQKDLRKIDDSIKNLQNYTSEEDNTQQKVKRR